MKIEEHDTQAAQALQMLINKNLILKDLEPTDLVAAAKTLEWASSLRVRMKKSYDEVSKPTQVKPVEPMSKKTKKAVKRAPAKG